MRSNENLQGGVSVNHHQFTLDSTDRERLWEERRRHFADYCVNRYQWFNYPKWAFVAPFPLHVDFEASFRCNLTCSMCFRPHIDKKEYGDMDFDLYKKGIDECVENKLYSIRLSWRGESTLNPRLPDMVAYAKERGIKEVSFISNGTNLTGELSKDLILAGLDYITISVDGPEESYNELRRPSTFETVTGNIRRLYELKQKTLDRYPMVKVQGIWTYIKDNPKAYYNHFKPITDYVCFDPENDYALRDVPKDPTFVCQYPWQRITVTWDGQIPLCISDWNVSVIIGNLNNDSIKEVWSSDQMTLYRELQLNQRILDIPACVYCHRPCIPNVGDFREGENPSDDIKSNVNMDTR